MKKLLLLISVVTLPACGTQTTASKPKDIVVQEGSLAEKFNQSFYRMFPSTLGSPGFPVSQTIKLKGDALLDYSNKAVKTENGQLWSIATDQELRKPVIRKDAINRLTVEARVLNGEPQYEIMPTPSACVATVAASIHIPGQDLPIGKARIGKAAFLNWSSPTKNEDCLSGKTVSLSGDFDFISLTEICSDSTAGVCDLVIERDLNDEGLEFTKSLTVTLKAGE